MKMRGKDGRFIRTHTIQLRPSRKGMNNRKLALHRRRNGARRVKGQLQTGYAPRPLTGYWPGG